MKTIIQLVTLGLFMTTLSSCDVGGAAHVGARAPYGHSRPSHYNNGYDNHRYYSNNRPSHYHSRPAPRPSGVNARVGTRGLPLNVNSNTRLGLF